MAIIIFFGVSISFLIKTLVFNMGLQESITEYLILIFFPLYQLIRMHMMKASIYSERGNKQSIKNLIITIVILVVTSAIFIFNSIKNSAMYDWQGSVVSLLAFIVLFIAIFSSPINIISIGLSL